MPELEPLRPGCMMRLILVRHGAPEERAVGRCYGRTDFHLSEQGRTQMRHSLGRLQGLAIDALYTSPLARAAESAQVAEELFGVQSKTAVELCEMDFGLFEGLRYEEIERLYPTEYKRWMEQPARVEFPGGESLQLVKQRVLKFIEVLEQHHTGDTVLIVAHGGVNRIVLAHALGFKDEATFSIPQEHGALNVIDYFSGALSVRILGA